MIQLQARRVKNGGRNATYADRLAQRTTMAILDVDQHRAMFTDAGFTDVVIDEDFSRGWICCPGAKPE